MAATIRIESTSRGWGRPARLARLLLIAASLTVVASREARAHDPGLSALDIRVGATEIAAVLSLAAADAGAVAGSDALGRLAREAIDVQIDGRQLHGAVERISVDQSGLAQIRMAYHTGGGARLTVKSAVAVRLPRGHRQLVSVRTDAGALLTDRMLDAHEDTVTVDVDRTGALSRTPGRFVILGIRHIWTGYDHLLFLTALLAVARGWRDVFRTITAFTIAHSMTLALAATGVVRVPGWIVEACIAASIVYVGVENLLAGTASGRWQLTFAFGLIHGLGFAAALQDLGIGRGAAVALPLASFNAGVEAGQLVLAAVVVPVFRRLNARPCPRFQVASAWSALVAAAGTCWLIERLVWPI